MSHPADPLIAAWLSDDLDADGVRALEDHLRKDPAARARFARFCQSETVLSQALKLAPVRPGTTGMRRAVRSSRRMRVRRPDGRLNWVLPTAAAALIGVVIILSVVGRSGTTVPTPTIATPVQAPRDLSPDQGPLELLRSDGEVRYAGKPLTSGMQVPRGAVIEVLSGTAELRWRSDGSLLTAAAGSALRVDDGATKVTVQQGRLDAHITQQVGTPFSIGGPHATATVMGTRFSLQVADGVTDLRVSEGRVRFTAVADRTAMEVIASESAQADSRGLRLPPDHHIRGFVPTAHDITRDLGGRMTRRGTVHLSDLASSGFNLRLECSDEVHSVSITMEDIEKRLEQVPAFHLFGDVKEQATRKWNPRQGTFTIHAQPYRDVEGHQALGPPVQFELTIVP